VEKMSLLQRKVSRRHNERSAAAKRGWETRRHNERSAAAKRGWETRRKHEKARARRARRERRYAEENFDEATEYVAIGAYIGE